MSKFYLFFIALKMQSSIVRRYNIVRIKWFESTIGCAAPSSRFTSHQVSAISRTCFSMLGWLFFPMYTYIKTTRYRQREREDWICVQHRVLIGFEAYLNWRLKDQDFVIFPNVPSWNAIQFLPFYRGDFSSCHFA